MNFGLFKKVFSKSRQQADITETYVQLIQNSINPMLALDYKKNIIAWNNKASAHLGWQFEEVINKSILDLLIPIHSHDKFNEWFSDWKELEKAMEFELLKKDGKSFPAMLHISELNTKKDIIKTGIIIVDLFKEKENEKKLLDKISFLNQGERDAEIGTWVWDLLGKEVEVSDNFCMLFNINKTEPITSDRLLELIYAEDRGNVIKTINESVISKKGYQIRYRRLQEDGTVIWLNSIANFSFDSYGDVKEIHGIIKLENVIEKTKVIVPSIKTIKRKRKNNEHK